jgi:hypothetical protein
MAIEISCSDPLVEKAVVLEFPDDAPAEGFTSAGVAGPEVDDFEPAQRLRVRNDDKSITAPYLILCGVFRGSDLGLDLDALGPVVLGSEQAFVKLPGDPPPSQHVLDGIAQLSSWLSQAPDQRGRIKPW